MNITDDQSPDKDLPLDEPIQRSKKIELESATEQEEAEKRKKLNDFKDAENAVPPAAWKNQKKSYDDAFENNKNRGIDNVD